MIKRDYLGNVLNVGDEILAILQVDKSTSMYTRGEVTNLGPKLVSFVSGKAKVERRASYRKVAKIGTQSSKPEAGSEELTEVVDPTTEADRLRSRLQANGRLYIEDRS